MGQRTTPGTASTSLAQLFEVLTALDLSPEHVQVFDPAHPWFDATRPLLVLAPQFEAARPALERRYPHGHAVRAIVASDVRATHLETLPGEASAWCVAALAPEDDARSLDGLRYVMERLYSPEGCPWDREQTHESLRKYLLEECYELVDAVDRGDLADLREELGDLLAHIFMHTSIAQEQGEFLLEDVTESAVRKMVRRHPHVFGDEAAGTNEELLARWDAIKAAERAASGNASEAVAGVLDSVSAAAPALQRAQSLQQRATRAGALEPVSAPLDDLAQLVQELEGRANLDAASLSEVLWSAIRLARSLDVDAEEALRERANEFTSSFANLEREARTRGVEVGYLPLEDRARPWRPAQ